MADHKDTITKISAEDINRDQSAMIVLLLHQLNTAREEICSLKSQIWEKDAQINAMKTELEEEIVLRNQ